VDTALTVLAPIAITAILALGAILFWRWSSAAATEYAQLCREACVALSTHAPAVTNVSTYKGKTPEGEQASEEARNTLRRLADELSEAVAPTRLITWMRGLPPAKDAHDAGRLMRRLSNSLTASGREDIAVYNEHNREDMERARQLLRCVGARRAPPG